MMSNPTTDPIAEIVARLIRSAQVRDETYHRHRFQVDDPTRTDSSPKLRKLAFEFRKLARSLQTDPDPHVATTPTKTQQEALDE